MTNATDKFQAQQYLANGGLLANFMPYHQRFTLLQNLDGEEGNFFVKMVLDLARAIRNMPMTYQTEDVEFKDKIVHLHYFRGSVDAWVVERDVGDSGDPAAPGADEGEQYQAFGKVTLYGESCRDAEAGYISIKELIDAGVELDLYWTPKTVKEC